MNKTIRLGEGKEKKHKEDEKEMIVLCSLYLFHMPFINQYILFDLNNGNKYVKINKWICQ